MRPGAHAAARRTRQVVVGFLATVALLGGACNPGAYPVDYFPEMHYAAYHRPLEPTRLSPPEGAVPITGRPPSLTYPQATNLGNPIPRDPENLALAREVYRVNCAMCHGEAGDGQGPMAPYYRREAAAVVPPPDFTHPHVRARTDGQLYWIIRHGLGNMPPFENLLHEREVWAAVLFIREVQGQ